MDDAIITIRKRLAAGEISVVEYERLLRLLSGVDLREKAPQETALARFENFALYKNHFAAGSNSHKLGETVMITAFAREISFNFIKSLEAGFNVKFCDGAAYGAEHNSTWPFKKDRYAQLMQFGHRIKVATFQPRLDNAVKRLNEQGKIFMGIGGRKEKEVYLTANGKLLTEIRDFDIKQCAATGTFGVGVVSFNGYQSPKTVLISATGKPRLGYGKESLQFDLAENEDVLGILLKWFADPKK